MGEWILVGTLADFSPAPGHGEDGIQMMEVSPAQQDRYTGGALAYGMVSAERDDEKENRGAASQPAWTGEPLVVYKTRGGRLFAIQMACPHQRSSLGSGEILDIEDLGRESDHSDSHPSQPNGARNLEQWREEGVDGKVENEVCQDEGQQITQHHGWKIHQSTIVPGAKLAALDSSAIGPLLACPSHAYIFHLPSGRCLTEGRCPAARTYAVRVSGNNDVLVSQAPDAPALPEAAAHPALVEKRQQVLSSLRQRLLDRPF